MKVRDLMTSQPLACSPGESLTAAAGRMWDGDCGLLPVTAEGRLVGVLTDRDICMGVASKGRAAHQLQVQDVTSRPAVACQPDDEVASALGLMAEHQVRRLPVTENGRLVGVMSINDAILEARATAGRAKAPTHAEVIAALQAICAHRGMPVEA